MTYNRYAREARPKLKEILEEFCDGPPDEEVKLIEEIQIARVVAARSVKIFEATCIDPEDNEKVTPQLKAMAAATLQKSLSHVASLVDKQAKIQALRADTISRDQLEYILERIVEKCTTLLEVDNPRVLERLVKEISKIQPPQTGAQAPPKVSITIE